MDVPRTNLERNIIVKAALAFLGAFQPTPIPLAGIHKFYAGQYGWGLVYVLLGVTPLPRIACAAEGMWYLGGPLIKNLGANIGALSSKPLTTSWMTPFPPLFTPETLTGPNLGETVDAVASGLREIEQLRQEGLLSEHEFEQKRRQLLEQMP
ncbi:hypothetical protein [Leptothoe sp. PORK10 BA2]|uniref:hypothetical protein n=1 Tax=Leptothoe sp. PORK10 BA2 TaxID=3110254 RepID=UPI002B21C092|nr:hypothetical protein [Leptothoe sp. PORK10 BA2]MEA5464014.1 hypothetical protein [Leptothoe sp. PORK10 BA2]